MDEFTQADIIVYKSNISKANGQKVMISYGKAVE